MSGAIATPCAGSANAKRGKTAAAAGIAHRDVSRCIGPAGTGVASSNNRPGPPMMSAIQHAFRFRRIASARQGFAARAALPSKSGKGARDAQCIESPCVVGRRSGHFRVCHAAGFGRRRGVITADHEAASRRRSVRCNDSGSRISLPALPPPQSCLPRPLGRGLALSPLHAAGPLLMVLASRLRPGEPCLPQPLGHRLGLSPLYAGPALPVTTA